MFGAKGEKIVVKLEQLELHLEGLECSQAEIGSAVETALPATESNPRSLHKPLPGQLPREVVTHLLEGDCCPDC